MSHCNSDLPSVVRGTTKRRKLWKGVFARSLLLEVWLVQRPQGDDPMEKFAAKAVVRRVALRAVAFLEPVVSDGSQADAR